jgi:hypothetical protein
LDGGERNKMPIITDCRINECQEPDDHCHIELSNISCILCQRIVIGPEIEDSKLVSKKSKNYAKNARNTNHKKTKKDKVRKQK